MHSDSSDDDNIELLKEAQDKQFLNDSMFNEKKGETLKPIIKIGEKESFPSLRKSKEEEEQFNSLGVTPEFRSYVAKQLSLKIEENLKSKLKFTSTDKIPRKKRKIGGIRLFSNCKNFIKVNQNKTVHLDIQNRKRPRKPDQEQPSEDQLKQISISGEAILNKEEVKHWSNRTKAQVFYYKKSKNGQLMIVEP